MRTCHHCQLSLRQVAARNVLPGSTIFRLLTSISPLPLRPSHPQSLPALPAIYSSLSRINVCVIKLILNSSHTIVNCLLTNYGNSNN